MKLLSPRTHTIIGFITGLALLAAPSVLDFRDVGGASVATSQLIGIIILLSELTVQETFFGIGFVPIRIHLILDMLLGAVLAISPWLFGFASEEANAWMPHLVVGVFIIMYALFTRADKQVAD
ncbi:MAG TPA: SPW repeat protein [Candidatus Dormibacteraeota bacterium]|nr:SPW repeat protein [Candidatus Dormibacteraeota bacterium]